VLSSLLALHDWEDTSRMDQPSSPSRAVMMLLAVSLLVLLADFVIIFVTEGPPVFGKLLGFVGCIGILGSVLVNHRQTAR
jgi:hypothetical protein